MQSQVYKKTYIGDSVYVEFDGWALVLTTENGLPDDPGNKIHLEPSVYANLLGFVDSIKKRNAENPNETH